MTYDGLALAGFNALPEAAAKAALLVCCSSPQWARVCAIGKSGGELLELLTTRLGNGPETERRVMREELAKINRIRMARLLVGDAA